MATKLENGDLSIITVAVWETIEHLDNARKLVQDEYRKINFDPVEFTRNHGITMDRQLYHAYDRGL